MNREGQPIRVDSMDLAYLAHLQKHLENHADKLRPVLWLSIVESLPDTDMGDDIAYQMEADDDLTPAEYMSRYPLYRRISVLLGDRRFEAQPARGDV